MVAVKQHSHQTTLQLRIRGRHAGMMSDLKGIKHCSHCVWLAQDSEYKSYLTRNPLRLNKEPRLFRILRRLDF